MKFLYLFFLLFIAYNTSAQSQPITVLPFTLENNHVFIYCKVNEHDSIKFLFDTGANGSVINSDSKRKLDLKIDGKSLNEGSNGTNSVEQSSNNQIRFGTIERQAVNLVLIPYGTDDFDGVFGTDLMQGNIVEIDYDKKEIRFYENDGKGLDLSSYQKMKLYLVDDYPCVKSEFTANGKKYTGLFGLDSGADDALTIASPFAKRNDLVSKMTTIAIATFQGSDGSVYEMPIVVCPSIQFSNKYLYNVPVALSSSTEGIDASDKMAGFFGNNFLKRFNMVIDFNNQLIYFRLNENLYQPFE